MHCKFLDHGVALSYDHVVKPCCIWTYDEKWSAKNHISQVDLKTWHQSPDVVEIRNQLAKGEWPDHCRQCRNVEAAGRADSMRLCGENSYDEYTSTDISLEIRPGSVCNFACQTCWPEASSRVAQYYDQAKIFDLVDLNSKSISNFDFLLPIVDRIRNVVVLGGEPFYDKNCLKFLDWAKQNLSANITMFTNGSMIKWDWIENYQSPITVVFSLDAVGRPAEYIRFGTEWDTVYQNFQKIQQYNNVNVRVNITTSVYNYIYLEELLDLLMIKWPSVVTFGGPFQLCFQEGVIPLEHRMPIIDSLNRALDKLTNANIESGQRHNAINAIKSIVTNLEVMPHDVQEFNRLCDFISRMDQVKKINIQDYCKAVSKMLSQ